MWPDELPVATVSLPGGLVLEDAPVDVAELRPLTGREEDWLVRNPRAESATAVTRMLVSCLVRVGTRAPTLELVRQLLVGDRDYLMLQLRRLTLGDEFQAVVLCPQCGARMDVTFMAGEVPVERRPQTTVFHKLDLKRRAGRKRRVRFRLPAGADQEAVLGMEPAAAVDALFARLVDDGGVPLSPEERNVVSDAIEQMAPQVEPELDLRCPECAHSFLAPFDTTAFFLGEMRSAGPQLLKEFHGLAFYYHWSETEILNLERDRRRAYLSLVSDELRRD